MTRRSVPLLAVSTFALAATGCLVGSTSETEESGRRVDQDALAQIKPGTEASRVLELLGEPGERRLAEGGNQVWSWTYRKTTESTDHVFLLFGGRGKTTHTQRTFVEIANDKVVRRWQE